MKEPFDLEKEALKVYYATAGCQNVSPSHANCQRVEDHIAAYGRRCADEALERAAVDCERDGKRITAENIRGLKSTASAPTERKS